MTTQKHTHRPRGVGHDTHLPERVGIVDMTNVHEAFLELLKKKKNKTHHKFSILFLI